MDPIDPANLPPPAADVAIPLPRRADKKPSLRRRALLGAAGLAGLAGVLLTPIIATGIGLLYAVLVDRARGEAVAKAFIFLPLAISLVGASIIWRFVSVRTSVLETQYTARLVRHATSRSRLPS